MSTYWYAVNDTHYEYIFVVGQNRPLEKSEVRGMLQPPLPPWVEMGDFRLETDFDALRDTHVEYGALHAALSRVLPDPGPPPMDVEAAVARMQARVEKVVAGLSEQERKVLALRVSHDVKVEDV